MIGLYFFLSGLFFLFLYWNVSAPLKKVLILIANILFLLTFGFYFLILHLLSSVMNFYSAYALLHFSKFRQPIVWACVFLNLALILYYKIMFSIDSSILIPLGLSYYTFINLGFVLDTYWNHKIPLVRFIDFYMFSGFFPAISMGPIERADDLWPEITKTKTWNWTLISEGLFLITLGCLKKLVIADRIYALSDPKNSYVTHYQGVSLWLFFLFSFIQIYCDFSSYIDMVRGFSKLMGINLKENFRQPYLAQSIPEIWSRWNISLLDWLRRYVYMPLLMRTKNMYLASLIVMVAVGFWHAVSWMFLAWAIYWTIFYWIHIALRTRGIQVIKLKTLRIAYVILIMVFSSIFIASGSFPILISTFIRAFTFDVNLYSFFNDPALAHINYLLISIFVVWTVLMETFHFSKIPNRPWLSFSLAALMAFLCIIFGVSNSHAFIYLRF